MDSGAEHYRRYLAGDDGSFSPLARDYRDGLIFYLNRLVHDPTLAEELTEDTFFKLAAHRPHYNGRASFKTWLYTIARNTALDHLRRQKRLSLFSLEALPREAAAADDPEQGFLTRERDLQLHRALNRLPLPYRQVLHLTYFEGFSNAETGAILKKSRRQVENLLTRARKALREQLKQEGLSDEDL